MKAEVKAMVRNIEAGSLSGMAETEGFSAPLSPLSGECDDEAVDLEGPRFQTKPH